MRAWLAGLIVVVAWTPALPAAEPSDPAVEAILGTALTSWDAPGIAAVVVRDDKIVALHGVGVRELGTDNPVTGDTLFAIGSCTKAFTATALGLLVADGKADWDERVRKHLPCFRLDDPLADRDVRLRDLLCHRIGLARHDLLWYRAPWSIEESVRRMAYLQRSTSFRSTYEYNNLAYLAAGLAIQSISKQPWHAFVCARLLKPLKMDHTVFTRSEALQAAHHASPHSRDNDGKVVVIPWYNDDKQIRASGSIKSSVRDLSAWLRLQLAQGKFNGERVVPAAVLEATHAPQIPVPLTAADRAADTTQSSYALGWHVRDYRGHGILEHGGAVDGFRARLILVPRRKLGLVLLTNLDDSNVVHAAGNSLLDHLLGLEKKDWNAFFKEEQKKKPAAKPRQRICGTHPRELDLYVGSYSEPAYGTVAIVRRDEKLLLKWSSFELPLTHFHYDTFLTPAGDRRLPEALRRETAVFEMNEDAEMATLRFLGRTFTRENPRKNGS